MRCGSRSISSSVPSALTFSYCKRAYFVFFIIICLEFFLLTSVSFKDDVIAEPNFYIRVTLYDRFFSIPLLSHIAQNISHVPVGFSFSSIFKTWFSQTFFPTCDALCVCVSWLRTLRVKNTLWRGLNEVSSVLKHHLPSSSPDFRLQSQTSRPASFPSAHCFIITTEHTLTHMLLRHGIILSAVIRAAL